MRLICQCHLPLSPAQLDETSQPFLGEESGQALIEFALVCSLFILILAGIANYASFIRAKIQVQEAAAAGAAYATIPGNYGNTAGIAAAAVASVSDTALGPKITTWMAAHPAVSVYSCSPGGAAVARTATCTDGGTPLMFIQVTTSATINAVLGLNGMLSTITLTGFASYEVPWV